MKNLLFYLNQIQIAVGKGNPSEVTKTDYSILWKIADGLGINRRLFGTDAHIPHLDDWPSETIVVKKMVSPKSVSGQLSGYNYRYIYVEQGKSYTVLFVIMLEEIHYFI